MEGALAYSLFLRRKKKARTVAPHTTLSFAVERSSIPRAAQNKGIVAACFAKRGIGSAAVKALMSKSSDGARPIAKPQKAR